MATAAEPPVKACSQLTVVVATLLATSAVYRGLPWMKWPRSTSLMARENSFALGGSEYALMDFRIARSRQ